MSYVKKTTHVAEGLDNLIGQFKDKEELEGLIASYLIQIQEIEDALSQILTDTTVEASVGAQLDALGSIVGEARSGRNDLQYSTAIRARQILNVSEGTPEDVIALIRAIAGDVGVEITEFFPASFLAAIVDAIDPSTLDTAQIGTLVAKWTASRRERRCNFRLCPGFQIRFWAGL